MRKNKKNIDNFSKESEHSNLFFEDPLTLSPPLKLFDQDFENDEGIFHNDINSNDNREKLFSVEKKEKSFRRDYFIKKIKVLAISKWLINEINYHLKTVYNIKKKVQKPSQTFIKETLIELNKKWINLSIEECFTEDYNIYYDNKKKEQCKLKQKKNESLFKRLKTKFKNQYEADGFFQRTIKDVINDYLNSPQYLLDKKKVSKEEEQHYDLYFKGNKEKNELSIIDYILKTPGNKKKKENR